MDADGSCPGVHQKGTIVRAGLTIGTLGASVQLQTCSAVGFQCSAESAALPTRPWLHLQQTAPPSRGLVLDL